MDAALDHLAEADLLGMGDALLEGLEDPALEQVGACTVCPSARSCSANPLTPGVRPWA